MYIKRLAHITPGLLILGALMSTIIIGSLLLLLPLCRVIDISAIDIIFTATSATCVTGLLTVPLNAFTVYGHAVILMLMQIGGLGLITMTIFVFSMFKQLGLTTQLLIGRILELESWKNIKQLLFFIIFFTLAIEGIGALIIFFLLKSSICIDQCLFTALFHAVSSFCDAGFSLWPNSMEIHRHNPLMLFITMILMVIGGLGFITWTEIIEYIRRRLKGEKKTFSLYTKVVLYTTFFLLIISATIFWLLERNHAFQHFGPLDTIVNALFNAVANRSTGFTTVVPTSLSLATLFVILLIAFIGSSPGSTGSGIKTTTFAVMLATVNAATSGKTSVEIRHRRIPHDQVFKAFAVIALSCSWITLITFLLLITETTWDFFPIFFEVVSAFATLGISIGQTSQLTALGKMLICLTMIVGRIGSLTLVLAIMKKRKDTHEYEYPEERIMLG